MACLGIPSASCVSLNSGAPRLASTSVDSQFRRRHLVVLSPFVHLDAVVASRNRPSSARSLRAFDAVKKTPQLGYMKTAKDGCRTVSPLQFMNLMSPCSEKRCLPPHSHTVQRRFLLGLNLSWWFFHHHRSCQGFALGCRSRSAMLINESSSSFFFFSSRHG